MICSFPGFFSLTLCMTSLPEARTATRCWSRERSISQKTFQMAGEACWGGTHDRWIEISPKCRLKFSVLQGLNLITSIGNHGHDIWPCGPFNDPSFVVFSAGDLSCDRSRTVGVSNWAPWAAVAAPPHPRACWIQKLGRCKGWERLRSIIKNIQNWGLTSWFYIV